VRRSNAGGFNHLKTAKLRASIYDRPLRTVKGADPTSFAAAALALKAIGELDDPWEASEWLEFEDAVEPDPHWSDVLGERYARFLNTVEARHGSPAPRCDEIVRTA